MMKFVIIFLNLILLFSLGLVSQETREDRLMNRDTGYVKVDGGKLFYEIAGDGEYIVLLHESILNAGHLIPMA